MKKGIKIALAVLMIASVMSLGLIGCAKEAATPPEAPPEPEAVEPIVLTFAHFTALDSAEQTRIYAPWAHRIETETDGRIEIEFVLTDSLFSILDVWPALRMGIVDITLVAPSLSPGAFKLWWAIGLPGMGWPSVEAMDAITWQLYEEFPEFAAELDPVHPLIVYSELMILFTKEEVKTVEDMEGLKLSFYSELSEQFFSNLGAVPTYVVNYEAPLAGQQGILDGLGHSWAPYSGMRYGEAFPYALNVDVGSTILMYAMNNDTWDSLGTVIQDQLTGTIEGYDASRFWGRYLFDLAYEGILDQIDQGIFPADFVKGVYTPPPAEMARFAEIGAGPIYDALVPGLDAEGYPATAFYNRAIELISEWDLPPTPAWPEHPDWPYPADAFYLE